MASYKVYSIAFPGSEVSDLFLSESESIRLGEAGRGRVQTIVPILGETGEFVKVGKTSEGVVLMRTEEPTDSPSATLVVVNTHGGYSKNRHYGSALVDSPPENYTVLAAGRFAEGIAGLAGSADHEFSLVQPGTTLVLESKYSTFYYTWNGRCWLFENRAQYRARKALEAFEAGGVEWL